MNVLLYYCYTEINDTEEYYTKHKEFCMNYDMTGRIIIATEGLNGTISASKEDCIKYMEFVKSDKRFDNIDFKVDTCMEHLFPKMSIKIKPYLIKLNAGIINKDTGTHLSPLQFYEMMKEDDSIILDVRSNYETFVGKFKNSVTLDIDKFYQFPDKIRQHQLYLDPSNHNKKILTCCTGGIKCETASAYLKQLGFKNVYQLQGGIIKYGIEQQGKNFDGKCYVFDGRITKNVNTNNPCNITKCFICNEYCDIMINCMNTLCNKHFTMCNECNVKLNGCCSIKCMKSEKIRTKIPNYYLEESYNKNLKN